MWRLLGKAERNYYINYSGRITKMAAMPIYGKNLLKSFFYRINSPMTMKLCMEYHKLKLYTIYINDDPELTLTYFTAISNLAKLVFALIKGNE